MQIRSIRPTFFFGNTIELRDDYIMYYLIHNYLWNEQMRANLLENIISFFNTEEFKVTYSYEIQNLSYDPFVLYSGDKFEISFLKQDKHYIRINLTDKLRKKTKTMRLFILAQVLWNMYLLVSKY